jgi:hypothetical protein
MMNAIRSLSAAVALSSYLVTPLVTDASPIRHAHHDVMEECAVGRQNKVRNLVSPTEDRAPETAPTPSGLATILPSAEDVTPDQALLIRPPVVDKANKNIVIALLAMKCTMPVLESQLMCPDRT